MYQNHNLDNDNTDGDQISCLATHLTLVLMITNCWANITNEQNLILLSHHSHYKYLLIFTLSSSIYIFIFTSSTCIYHMLKDIMHPFKWCCPKCHQLKTLQLKSTRQLIIWTEHGKPWQTPARVKALVSRLVRTWHHLDC